MTIKQKISAAIALWIFCGLISAGAMNASFRGEYPSLYFNSGFARSRCASFYGFGLIFGPVGVVLSPFMTGFYQHGWTLNCGPLERP